MTAATSPAGPVATGGPAGTGGPGGPAAPRRGWSPVTRLAVVVGGVLLGLVLLMGFLGEVVHQTRSYDPVTASAEGVTNLDVDVSSGNLTVTCGSSEEFVLTQKEVTAQWHMTSENGMLRVWQVSKYRWLPRVALFDGSEEATLQVPQSVCEQNLDADLAVKAGSLSVTADLNAADVHVGAGSLSLGGSANSVSVKIDAGSARVNLDGARTASVKVSAGSVSGSLSQVPESLTVDVDAGSATLALPAGSYSVSTDTEAGSVTNDLAIDSSGPVGKIDVKVDAGSVILKEKK